MKDQNSQTENTLIEIEVKIKVFDPATGQMTEALSTTSKLTKADAGITKNTDNPLGTKTSYKIQGTGYQEQGNGNDNWVHISIEPGIKPNYADAKVKVSCHLKSVLMQSINKLLSNKN